MGVANAQTVTVNPAGSPSSTVFNDIQSAIVSFTSGGDNHGNPAPDIINVRSDQGALIGKITADTEATASPISLDEDLTIQGVDATSAPALAVFAGLPHSNDDQIIRASAFPAFVWRQPVNLTIKNIAFIPANNPLGNPISSFMAIKAPMQAGINPNVNIDSCVFTANDGNNLPITTTGKPEDDAKLNAPGVIGLHRVLPNGGAAGIYAFSREERGDLNVNLVNTVFASIATLTGVNPRTEIFKAWMSGTPEHMINMFININEGCVFANIDGNLAQIGWGGMIRMNGTDTKPVVVRKFAGTNPPALIWLYYSTGVNQPVAGEFEHVHFHEIAPLIISEGGTLGDGSQSFINFVKDCVFADSPNDALTLRSKTTFDTVTGLAKPELTVENSVFHNVGSGGNPSGIYSTAALERNVIVKNSYFTDSDANMVGLNNNSAVSVWTATDSILSLTPPTALRDATFGSGVINTDSSVTNGAVSYVNTTDPFSPDFFKVVSVVPDWSVY